jgi:PTH1 family peptidyl-tRNA hydrolase
MVVVAGLGNPGRKYARTRHNVGFMVIDRLAEALGVTLTESALSAEGTGALDGCEVVLLKPLTFMNRSGRAVKDLLRKEGVPLADLPTSLIVVHDDLDIETGVVRVRRNGSSGGHKGVESVIQEIGSREFIRVKVGIGRDREVPAEEYVLSTFRRGERDAIARAVDTAAEAVTVIIRSGLARAMETFNRTSGTGEDRP